MRVENHKIEALLHRAQTIAKHQEEIKYLRGESFNVFSILKMETRENETHSAFLGELLNPKGSHMQGSLFLKIFLQTIGHTKLDISTASVVLEESIGTRSDSQKEGGRVDIYIKDAVGNTICIENKIDAIDQFAQIERYVKHNKLRNTVYYLTKDGKDASKESQGELKSGEDYYCISYQGTIIAWLKECLKESAELPLLRESIRQYIILIKKITNQMTDSEMEAQIEDLIRSNYSAAKLIQSNIEKTELKEIEGFLKKLKARIESDLSSYNGWTIIIDEDLSSNWKGIRVSHNNWNGFTIVLMGAPQWVNSTTIFGVTGFQNAASKQESTNRLSSLELFQNGYKANQHWVFYQYYSLFDTIEKSTELFEKSKVNDWVERVASKFIEVGILCKDNLSGIQPAKN